jgi:hypothetical protein
MMIQAAFNPQQYYFMEYVVKASGVALSHHHHSKLCVSKLTVGELAEE